MKSWKWPLQQECTHVQTSFWIHCIYQRIYGILKTRIIIVDKTIQVRYEKTEKVFVVVMPKSFFWYDTNFEFDSADIIDYIPEKSVSCQKKDEHGHAPILRLVWQRQKPYVLFSRDTCHMADPTCFLCLALLAAATFALRAASILGSTLRPCGVGRVAARFTFFLETRPLEPVFFSSKVTLASSRSFCSTFWKIYIKFVHN